MIVVSMPLTQPANTWRARPAMLRTRPAAVIGSMIYRAFGGRWGNWTVGGLEMVFFLRWIRRDDGLQL